MLSVIPGIAGTQVFCLYLKAGRYKMVSEHSVACRIENLGLETIGIKLIFKLFVKNFYSALVYSFCSILAFLPYSNLSFLFKILDGGRNLRRDDSCW